MRCGQIVAMRRTHIYTHFRLFALFRAGLLHLKIQCAYFFKSDGQLVQLDHINIYVKLFRFTIYGVRLVNDDHYESVIRYCARFMTIRKLLRCDL